MKHKAGRQGAKGRTNVIGLLFSLVLAAFLAVLVLFSAMLGGGIGTARASNYTAQGNLEPTPGLAGNVTISTLPYGGGVLGYTDSSGAAQTLVAHVDTSHVANPYQLNPAAVTAQGSLQGDKVAGGLWNNTTLWNAPTTAAGQHATGPTLVTVNGLSGLQWTINATNGAAESSVIDFKSNIVQALYPSVANPSFDYWTEIWDVSSSVTCASCAAYLSFANASGNGQNEKIAWSTATGGIEPIGSAGSTVNVVPAVGSNSILYFSASLAQLSSSANLGLNLTGAGSSANLNPTIWLSTPKTTTATVLTATLVGMSFSSAPLTFGRTYWGGSVSANVTRQAAVGALNLSTIAPSFTYTAVVGGGFTVAVRQAASDVGASSISQTANPNGSETLTYVFSFGFPIAPSLSYGAFKVTDTPRLANWQYASVSYGGAAYTAVYQVKANIGNYTNVVSSVVPTTAATWVATITYTPTEWDAISTGPGFFSSNGIQFYWYELIGAILLFTGLGASAWATRNQRALRTRAVQPPMFSGLIRWLSERNRPTLREDERGLGGVRAHHWAAMLVGLLLIVGGAAGAWAVETGGSPTDAFGTFLAAIIVFAVIMVIAIVVYEVGHHVRHRRG